MEISTQIQNDVKDIFSDLIRCTFRYYKIVWNCRHILVYQGLQIWQESESLFSWFSAFFSNVILSLLFFVILKLILILYLDLVLNK